MITEDKINAFQKHIFEWYLIHKRDLPWRKNRDPYHIFVSEVMSQQTQLSRVVPKYIAWMEAFPTIEDLAKASVLQVLHFWSGLGYNRRALNMKKAAEKIVQEHNGIFPRIEKELIVLPGIGKYTARAILCFAYDDQIAVVDTNIRKVILTQFLNSEYLESQKSGKSESLILGDSDSQSFPKRNETKIAERLIEKLAAQLLPSGRAYEWNQALMDYAASVLKKEKIPIPKQSKFHGSHRYYRGQILKVLLQKKKLQLKELGLLIKKEYSSTEEEWLKKLVDELVTEGFITLKNGVVELSS